MDFKFIVLALVISLAAGEEAKKIESPVIRKNDKVELNKNEELPAVKDYVTSTKSEKIMHDLTNTTEGKMKDLAVIDINKSSADAIVDVKNETVTKVATPASSPAPTPSPTLTTSNTTTSIPTTTTLNNSTITTAKPTIAPVPEQGNWTVNDSNTVCIVMQMEIEFNITYPGNNDTMYNKTIYISKSANATGHCGKTSQDIVLKWGSGNFFDISFIRNESMGKFHINYMNLTVNSTSFENIRGNVSNLTYVSTKPDFPVVPLKMSYRCDKQLKQKLQTEQKYNATLFVSHTQFQAFMDNKTVFGEVKDCDEFDTPDIVPIAVGCVLAILVLIVLVAYLIGRRRSQNRGYLSM